MFTGSRTSISFWKARLIGTCPLLSRRCCQSFPRTKGCRWRLRTFCRRGLLVASIWAAEPTSWCWLFSIGDPNELSGCIWGLSSIRDIWLFLFCLLDVLTFHTLWICSYLQKFCFHYGGLPSSKVLDFNTPLATLYPQVRFFPKKNEISFIVGHADRLFWSFAPLMDLSLLSSHKRGFHYAFTDEVPDFCRHFLSDPFWVTFLNNMFEWWKNMFFRKKDK